MTDYTKPRPGDKVRATLPTVDGVLVAADGQGVQLRLDDGSIHHLPGADIHVLERADGPAYRVGHKNPRNIYRVDGSDDVHVGVMFDPDDGPRVVEALKAFVAATAAAQTVTGEGIDRWAEEDAEVPVGGEVERAQQRRQQPRRRTFPYEVREWMDEEARVECFSGCDADHVVHEGVAIGLTEAPTVRVQKDDGQIVSWVIGLTRRAFTEVLPS